jgi:hypothetical protein
VIVVMLAAPTAVVVPAVMGMLNAHDIQHGRKT